MDLNKLDIISGNFIKNNKFYVDILPIIVDYSKQVYKEQPLNINNEWSKAININDSINIVYNFLKSIDLNIANQFYNILNSKDENNNPYVNILPKSKYPNEISKVKNGKVFIYYNNTPNDAFIILHEMLHKMNECNIKDIMDSFTRDCFGETVSILGELLLGNYMVGNNLITVNDFDIRKNNRLNGCKENARDIIIENELIKIKLNNNIITYDNLLNILDNYSDNSIEYVILNDEKNDHRRINEILKNDKLSFDQSKRYVIAKILSDEIIQRSSCLDDFIKLHYAVGNKDIKINEVYDEIINKKDDSRKINS